MKAGTMIHRIPRRVAALVATVLVAVLLAGCHHPMRPLRCSKAHIVIDGQAYMSCAGVGLVPTRWNR